MSNRYVEFSETGGPEVLQVREGSIPSPGDDEILVKNESIGFNFIDTYFRNGLYPVKLPYKLGGEGAGIVEAVGPNVKGFKTRDRVVYLGTSAYADYTVVKAVQAAKIPDGISSDVAAASALKGLTAQYLLEKIYTPKQDEVILFHSGAGGVGLIFLQWAKSLGAKVITTVSTDEKAQIAREHGAWHVLKYTDDIPAKVSELTNGKKVKVVYDSVGKDTFHQSIDSLAVRGWFVMFGNSSGPPPPIPPILLTQKGSLFVTRPSLTDYLENFPEQIGSFFKLVRDGTVKIKVNQNYRLEDVQQLHRDAEARKTIGSTVINP